MINLIDQRPRAQHFLPSLGIDSLKSNLVIAYCSTDIDCSQVAPTASEDKTRGRIRLTFSYSMEKKTFSVYVHKADHLVPESNKGVCDPYVKW